MCVRLHRIYYTTALIQCHESFQEENTQRSARMINKNLRPRRHKTAIIHRARCNFSAAAGAFAFARLLGWFANLTDSIDASVCVCSQSAAGQEKNNIEK